MISLYQQTHRSRQRIGKHGSIKNYDTAPCISYVRISPTLRHIFVSAFNTLDFYQNWDILFSFSSFQGVRGERKGNLHIYIKIPKIAKWGSLIFKFIPRIRWSLRRRRERGRRVCQKLFRCLDYRCLCSPNDTSDQIINMMSMIIIKMITSAIMATMRREIKHKIKKIWGKYHDVCIHIHIILVRTFDYLCSLYTGHNIWFFMLTLYRSEHLIFLCSLYTGQNIWFFYAHFILVRTFYFLCYFYTGQNIWFFMLTLYWSHHLIIYAHIWQYDGQNIFCFWS